MKIWIIAAILSVFIIITSAYAGTAYYTGERLNTLTKTCYYNYYGETVSCTVGVSKPCPLTINVN
jgi:hypothetical protein